MKHLQTTTLTPLPTLCIAFQFQVSRPESAAMYGIHATLVDRGACFHTDSFSFKVMSQTWLMPPACFSSPTPFTRDYTCLSA